MIGLYSDLQPPFPNLSKQALCILYMFVSNCGILLSFEQLGKVAPAFDRKCNIAAGVCQLRKIIKRYGFYIVSKRNVGYKCIRMKTTA